MHLRIKQSQEGPILRKIVYSDEEEQRAAECVQQAAVARGTYGFTKRLGEEVCRNAWYRNGLSVNALRLCFPCAREVYHAQARAGVPSIPTDAEDVARLMLAALEYRNGFQAFLTSGDYENKIMNMDKARRLLGWEPLARPIS